ncbi:hypothetical protein L211DRAFT_414662 [Terfezia boudieri ATCC MYA-4762]|uniref:Uncharacterized protein n=1 Tax=Terfezia boudieri ATCC MYA-4762 TaxID=1051890 RepID=A0A3N4LFP4_9PEZI|nr:hypothetical protein L211DRAFT_414662 [Terfezia boudieri ATCC MYA-4762]
MHNWYITFAGGPMVASQSLVVSRAPRVDFEEKTQLRPIDHSTWPGKGKRKDNPGKMDRVNPPLKTRIPVTDHPEPQHSTPNSKALRPTSPPPQLPSPQPPPPPPRALPGAVTTLLFSFCFYWRGV